MGQRQVLRELKKGNLDKIILAADADKSYVLSVTCAAAEYGVETVMSGTKKSIAAEYCIDVESAAVGILKR